MRICCSKGFCAWEFLRWALFFALALFQMYTPVYFSCDRMLDKEPLQNGLQPSASKMLTSKRITSKQRRDDNPKFAMRTWAIRLGFNGAEYKGLRAYLMKRLPGDAAWRFGKPDNSLPTEPRLPINVRVTA